MAARDLNKAFITYAYTTLTDTKQTVDVTTLVAKGLPAIIASKPTEVDDVNTLYYAALP